MHLKISLGSIQWMTTFWRLSFSGQLQQGCSKVTNNLTWTQMASDPGCQAEVICGVERGPGHGGETRREKSREEGQQGRGAERKAGQGRDCSERLLCHPRGCLCLRSCQSRGDASPRGHRPPGRWENNSSFCRSLEGQGLMDTAGN